MTEAFSSQIWPKVTDNNFVSMAVDAPLVYALTMAVTKCGEAFRHFEMMLKLRRRNESEIEKEKGREIDN